MSRRILRYIDDEPYDVELGDKVEVNDAFLGPETYEGEVTAIYPLRREVRVRYKDHTDWSKTTGEAKIKAAKVGLRSVTFIGRVQ